MHPVRRLAFLSAAIAALAAVLAIVLPPSSAPAAAVSPAGTRVGASHPATIPAVGASRPVSAGQGRCREPPQPYLAAGACVAAEDGGGGVAKSIALGLDRGSGGEELLQPFADARGAFTNSQWIKEGLAEQGPFEQRFAQAAQRSIASGGRIQFNLDQFSITRGLETDTSEGPYGPGGFTNWEFQQVLNSPTLYPATDWWIGSEQITGDDIEGFGLGPGFSR